MSTSPNRGNKSNDVYQHPKRSNSFLQSLGLNRRSSGRNSSNINDLLVLPESAVIYKSWVVHGEIEPEKKTCHKELPPTSWQLHYAKFTITTDFVLVATFYEDDDESKIIKHQLIINNPKCEIKNIHPDIMKGSLLGVYFQDKLIQGFFIVQKDQRTKFKNDVMIKSLTKLQEYMSDQKKLSQTLGLDETLPFQKSRSLSENSQKMFRKIISTNSLEPNPFYEENKYGLIYITVEHAKDLDYFDDFTENDPFVTMNLLRYDKKEDEYDMLQFKGELFSYQLP